MKKLSRYTFGALCLLAIAPTAAIGKPPKVRDCWYAAPFALKNVPLEWRPTEEISSPRVMVIPLVAGGPDAVPASPMRIQVKLLADTRRDPVRIGENLEDVNHGCVYPVMTHDDVPAWATDRLRYLLGHLGFEVVEENGDAVVSGELRQFFVTETSHYDGQVGFRFDVVSKSGKALWSGLVGGSNGHFGRSYKLANYYETLSDAMIDAVKHLTSDPGFVQAITVPQAEQP